MTRGRGAGFGAAPVLGGFGKPGCSGAVCVYIRRQAEHHRVKPFAEEYADLMQRLGFVLLPGEDT